ncbi:amidohydrolase [Actinomadura napierensis]|uniref:Amidohydrolase n=1 Tax=Actinomadura napierensis TaxID=267854 RepID=A0ABP5LWM8_9ACTN
MTADLILRGRIITMDDARPFAGALAVRGEHVLAVGDDLDELDGLRGPATRVIDVDGCILPGFVEAHGHFLGDATVQSPALVDIRPVVLPTADEVLAAIREAVATRPVTVCNGWEPLLQKGLPEPTLSWLDGLAPASPLIVMHNSGHAVFFNSVAMRQAGLSLTTPDPPGGRFSRNVAGELAGAAYEPAAISMVTGYLREGVTDITPSLLAQSARVNARGVTMMSEMAFDPGVRPLLEKVPLTTRLRLYEVSTPALESDAAPGAGDDMIRQIGIKTWADGSPWTGNLAASFPYLATGERHAPNYSDAELLEISRAYYAKGWQLACHANGDDAVQQVLDVWERMLGGRPDDRRLRIEHASSMRPEQFERAHALGITCSLFPDHIYYWGEVLNELFGPDVAGRWAPIGTALSTGMRVSLHNDSPVTPANPLHNIAVAATRMSRRGHAFGIGERIGVRQALRAQTIDAAWQLHADDITGSLTPGKYADLAVVSADPTRVQPEEIEELTVDATFLAGRQVHGDPLA